MLHIKGCDWSNGTVVPHKGTVEPFSRVKKYIYYKHIMQGLIVKTY